VKFVLVSHYKKIYGKNTSPSLLPATPGGLDEMATNVVVAELRITTNFMIHGFR
jgi:hypothetical protein